MNATFEKSAGISLLLGTFLMFITMVLHPVGGDIQHLIKIKTMGMVSHSIALVSIPFVWFGFWGVTKRIESAVFFSRVGFSFITFALIAVMISAALNGLVLTFFISKYSNATPEVLESIEPFLRFNRSLNHAFDYVFMAGTLAAILLWSIGILRAKTFPKWLAYLGIGITLIALTMWILGFYFVDLTGFRVFIFGMIAWILIVGIQLFRTPKKA